MLNHEALQLDYLFFHKPFRAAEMLKIDGSNEAAWERKSKYAERSAPSSISSKKITSPEIKKEKNENNYRQH